MLSTKGEEKMLPTTTDAVKAMLKADPTLTPGDRTNIMTAIVNHGAKPDAEKQTPAIRSARILTRAEVAKRFGRTLRFVDKLACEGTLRRVTLPGRKRSCGYLEKDVEELLHGAATE